MYGIVHPTLNELSYNLFDAFEKRPIDRSVSHGRMFATKRAGVEIIALFPLQALLRTVINTAFQRVAKCRAESVLREPLNLLPDTYGGIPPCLCYTSAV